MRRLVDFLLVVVPAAVLTLLPSLLRAQPALGPGKQVRVAGRVTRGFPLVARLVESRGDTLVLDDGGAAPLVLLTADLDAIEVREEHPAREAAITVGILAGLAGGTAAAVNLCRGHGPDCWYLVSEDDPHTDEENEAGIFPSLGTLTVGALAFVGGAIGALVTPDRWRRVGGAAAAPFKVGIVGARRGLGVALSIPFGGPDRERPRPAR